MYVCDVTLLTMVLRRRMDSEEFQQQTAKSYVMAHIMKDGQYCWDFRGKYADFAQKCASARAAQPAAEALLAGLGLGDMGIRMPHRSTSTWFKVVEATADLDDWLSEMDLFGLNTDGSKRGDGDYFEVIVFGFNKKLHKPDWRCVNVVDMGAYGDALSIAKVLLWTVRVVIFSLHISCVFQVTVHCRLNTDKWFISMSDNTNTMSGERDVKSSDGGCFKQVRQHLSTDTVTKFLGRVPCTFHVIHLAYTNVRPVLFAGCDEGGKPIPIPGPMQRDIEHIWNLLFDVYNEFGHDSVDFPEMKADLLAELGKRLTKTWKPVSTRWLYEHHGIGWLLENWDIVLWCCDWQTKRAQKRKKPRGKRSHCDVVFLRCV